MSGADFLDIAVLIGMVLVLLSVLFAFIRLARGPSFSDRVVALDMMNVSVVAFCALMAIRTGIASFLDVGIVLALIGFLATVALARFAERGLHRKVDVATQDLIDRMSLNRQRARQDEEAE